MKSEHFSRRRYCLDNLYHTKQLARLFDIVQSTISEEKYWSVRVSKPGITEDLDAGHVSVVFGGGCNLTDDTVPTELRREADEKILDQDHDDDC